MKKIRGYIQDRQGRIFGLPKDGRDRGREYVLQMSLYDTHMRSSKELDAPFASVDLGTDGCDVNLPEMLPSGMFREHVCKQDSSYNQTVEFNRCKYRQTGIRKKHARLLMDRSDPGRVLIIPHKDGYGRTWVDGIELNHLHPIASLGDGSKIKMGGYTLRFFAGIKPAKASKRLTQP